MLKAGSQRKIAERVNQELASLPLSEQRRLIQGIWATAMFKQQKLVKFNSPMEQVRSHYPDYPLDAFKPPRKLSAEELHQLLPYLVSRAGGQRQYQVEERVQELVSDAFTQDALNIMATAFRQISDAAVPVGELAAFSSCWECSECVNSHNLLKPEACNTIRCSSSLCVLTGSAKDDS